MCGRGRACKHASGRNIALFLCPSLYFLLVLCCKLLCFRSLWFLRFPLDMEKRMRERCEDVWRRERGNIYSKRLRNRSKNLVMSWSRWILKQEKRRDGNCHEICNTLKKLSLWFWEHCKRRKRRRYWKEGEKCKKEGKKRRRVFGVERKD